MSKTILWSLTLMAGLTLAPAAVAAARAGENRIGRVADLRQHILDDGPGVELLHLALEKENGAPVVVFHPVEWANWRGILRFAAAKGGLPNGGRLAGMTHLVIELEPMAGSPGIGFAFSVKDASGRGTWDTLSVLPGAPRRFEIALHDLGLDMDNLREITVQSHRAPMADHRVRINALRLESRPDTAGAPVEALVALVRANGLDAGEAASLDEAEKVVAVLRAAVAGERPARSAMRAFFAAVENLRAQAHEVWRSSNARAVRAAAPGLPYGVGLADSMTAVFLEENGFRMRPAEGMALEMAANETECFQTVVVAGDVPLAEARVTVEPPRGPDGAALAAEAVVVGHWKTAPVLYPTDYTGMHPDFLIDYQTAAAVGANETVPFWVRIRTAPDTPPGVYRGAVEVGVAGAPSLRFPLEVAVFGFALPDAPVLPSIWGFDENHLAPFGELDDAARAKAVDDLVAAAAAYKIPYDKLGLTPGMPDEHFSKYWKAQNEAGILKSFTAVHLPDPNHSIDPDNPGYVKARQSVVDHMAVYEPKIRELGLVDKAYLYCFDEGGSNPATQATARFLKERFPDFKTMATIVVGDLDDPLVDGIDAFVPTASRFQDTPELIEGLRAKGKEMWWYVCNFPRPPYPTLMTDVPAPTPRLLMGWMAAKYQPHGFLYWSLTHWRRPKEQKVVGDGPRTDWDGRYGQGDNGDGSLFVPGRGNRFLPTIRLENYRDGVEDHWYHELLRRRVAAAAGLPEAVLAEARAALTVPAEVVAGVKSHTEDPEAVRAYRRRLARALEALGEARAE